MLKYIVKRILSLIPVLLGVAFIVFTLLYLTPGDPARIVLGEQATAEALQEFREKEGLNDSFLVQFGNYIWKAVTQGDIGRSYMTRRSVANEIMSAFPSTLKLALSCVIAAVLLGIPIGILSAIRQNTLFDNITRFLAIVGLSMPVFWQGVLLILLFSVKLRWFPASGFDTWATLVLPTLTLACNPLAVITRMTRSSMLEVVRQDYIRTARAKGQTEQIVIWRHALGNALIPIVTVIGLQFGTLLAGAVLTESIFSIPGVGRLMVDAIKMRDYPVVQGGVLFIAVAFSFVNLMVDLLYAWIDPRIRAQYR